jgi:hypothetical protein
VLKAVHQDRHIEIADSLPPSAIKDHIPHLLLGMSTVLSQTEDSEINSIPSFKFNKLIPINFPSKVADSD